MSLHQNTSEDKPRIKYDPTINLGHILTFIGFILAIFASWTAMDKRIVVIEARMDAQTLKDQAQDAERALIRNYTSETMNDIKNTLRRIEEKVDNSKRSN